jgi:hypothetical protein
VIFDSTVVLSSKLLQGIIGANPGNEFNISGVAFEASLTSYRIFGCTGTVPDDSECLTKLYITLLLKTAQVIVDALLRGQKDGQDILTMSLGGADGWTEGSASVVASRIASTGRIVTIAAGEVALCVCIYYFSL